MNRHAKTLSVIVLVSALWGTTGCAGLDHIARKLDMVSERMASAKPVYEGHLKSAQRVGSMVALQFADGQYFDVRECPSTLLPGDIVRIYKTENGYEAHLWHATKGQLQAADESPLNPASRRRS